MTLKGMKSLEQAHVVLYDKGLNKILLKHTQPSCKRVDVSLYNLSGDIARINVFYAYRYGAAVRLISEDFPDYNEIEYAHQRGLQVKLVQGVSGMLSAPASIGISLTRRGINESIWVSSEGAPFSDETRLTELFYAAQSSACIIMKTQVNLIPKISTIFKTARGEQEPIAVMFHDRKNIKGTVGNLCVPVNAGELRNHGPVILIIGKIAAENLDFCIPEIFNLAI